MRTGIIVHLSRTDGANCSDFWPVTHVEARLNGRRRSLLRLVYIFVHAAFALSRGRLHPPALVAHSQPGEPAAVMLTLYGRKRMMQ
jgi:hypothetical protein